MGINVPKSMPPSFFATAASVFIFLVDAEVEMELFCKKRFISRPFKSLQCCATLVLTIESLYKTFQNFQAFKYNTSAEKKLPLTFLLQNLWNNCSAPNWQRKLFITPFFKNETFSCQKIMFRLDSFCDLISLQKLHCPNMIKTKMELIWFQILIPVKFLTLK